MLKKLGLNVLLLAAVAVVFAACSNNNSNKENKGEFIVGTFNIDAKVHGNTKKQREWMAKNKVEIFGAQEINYKNNRFLDEGIKSYDPLIELTESPYKQNYYGNAVDFAGGGYGIATISTVPLTEKSTTKLVTTDIAKTYQEEFSKIYASYDPTKIDTVHALDAMDKPGGINTKGAMEPRVYTRVVFEKDGKKVAFYNTHLNYEDQELRQKQMEQIKDAMKNDPIEYTIAVGDFNADQSTKEFDVWRKDFRLANGGEGVWYDTFVEKDDVMKVNSIDNIIVSKNIDIESVKVGKEKLSDHMPLIAKVRLK